MTRDPPNIGFDPACCLSLDTCSKSSQKLSWAASQLCQQGMSDTTGFPLNTKEQLWPPHGAAACAALSRLLPAQTCFVTTSPRLVNLDKHGAMTFVLSSHQNAKKIHVVSFSGTSSMTNQLWTYQGTAQSETHSSRPGL